MCGIAGKYDLKAEVSVNDLEKMSSALKHRGPDGEGFWINETKNLGLAHRRLQKRATKKRTDCPAAGMVSA